MEVSQVLAILGVVSFFVLCFLAKLEGRMGDWRGIEYSVTASSLLLAGGVLVTAGITLAPWLFGQHPLRVLEDGTYTGSAAVGCLNLLGPIWLGCGVYALYRLVRARRRS